MNRGVRAMTNEETIAYFKECNERLVSVAKDENVYDYEKKEIEAVCMKETFDANEKAIQALEQTKWIPVIERLPENAKHKGAFCPKYHVMTEFGQTEGWYNPDVGCWYVLLWFMDARFESWNINFEKGDVPKIVKNVPVVAWMPFPELYRSESEDKE